MNDRCVDRWLDGGEVVGRTNGKMDGWKVQMGEWVDR